MPIVDSAQGDCPGPAAGSNFVRFRIRVKSVKLLSPFSVLSSPFSISVDLVFCLGV